jgi:beta-glucosidase
MEEMIASVNEGQVPIEWIDRAVKRILRLKFQLGLFEDPFVDAQKALHLLHTEAHKQLALRAAREGIVLLKNEKQLLPLSKDIRSIAVIGPNADSPLNQLGDYTPRDILHDVVTVLDGIRSHISSATRITYIQGCDILGTEVNEISRARDTAASAEVAVVVVGESQETCGEKRDAATLELTGLQQELVQAVHSTGTPTVVILVNGRPLAIPWISENVPVIVEAWFCGERGGDAVADVLFGDYNPSGRLPITVPRHAGQLPVYYNFKPSKAQRWPQGYVDLDVNPLWPFGHGLSYSEFAYSNLQLSLESIGVSGSVEVSVEVTNVGSTVGTEVVQFYINDLVSSTTTAVQELRGFEKLRLAPGEARTVTVSLKSEDLSLLDRDLKWVVEPGEFEVMVGRSSTDIRLRETFSLTGS